MNITNTDGCVPSSISFGPAPTIPESFSFGPAPVVDYGSFTFGPSPKVNPATFTFGPSPNVNPATFTFGPSPKVDPGSFTFGPAPSINPGTFNFGPAPTVSVEWGTIPSISVNIGDHQHTMSDISDVTVQGLGDFGPLPSTDVALTYRYSTGEWVAKDIGTCGVGSTPLPGGWPSGSLGASLDEKAPKSNASFTGTFSVESDSVRVQSPKTPASSSDVGTQGQICWDSNFVYVCVAENTWKRSALASW